jgi:hypothetical protein
MIYIKHFLCALVVSVLLVGYSTAQIKPSKQTKKLLVPVSGDLVIEMSGDYVSSDIFYSTSGRFSIAIPELPQKTIEQTSEKGEGERS